MEKGFENETLSEIASISIILHCYRLETKPRHL
jgi:hypothetical protein